MVAKKDKAIYINELPQETLDKLEKNALDFTVSDDYDEEEITDIVTSEAEEINSVEEVKYNENIDYKSRGFDTLEQAIGFVNTIQFSKLGQADKNEYLAWLKK